MRKRGEDISILSDKNCKIISDPYSRYERQDTGIYKIIKLLGPTEFRYNAVHLSFPNPTIGRFMWKHVAATSGNPARPGRNRSSTRLGPLAISAKCDTSFRTVYLTTVYKNGGELPGQRPLGRTHQMWISHHNWCPFSTQQVSEWRLSLALIMRPDGLVGI